MTEQHHYKSQVLDHLGLVAGIFDELGIGEMIDRATQQDPLKRDLTVGEAVKAMVLNDLGYVNHALYLVEPGHTRLSAENGEVSPSWPPAAKRPHIPSVLAVSRAAARLGAAPTLGDRVNNFIGLQLEALS